MYTTTTTELVALIDAAIGQGRIVPIAKGATIVSTLPKGNASLVLIRTSRGQTPSRQAIGRGIARDAAIQFAKGIDPLLPMGAWFAVEG